MKMSISNRKNFINNWVLPRELGFKYESGTQDRINNSFYRSLSHYTSWDQSDGLKNGSTGGIFNLEFSLDGSFLVAACEKKNVLLFDPLSQKLIRSVEKAHDDCVNCVKFLDSRVFATCSDDSTVALWDARNLSSRIRSLRGHSNWVKNIEFSPKDGLLVTSGFDGKIYSWDINSYTESGFVYNQVFHTNGLMRTRLTPDASKMIICTTTGYILIIHDLDLNTLSQDFSGFKPNIYRLMQRSQSRIPIAEHFNHLFSRKRKRNRVELVTDFPPNDEAEIVSSLQIHPHGWCALSRNTSEDEQSEWTCVHDIQELDIGNMEEDSEADDCGDDHVSSGDERESSTDTVESSQQRPSASNTNESPSEIEQERLRDRMNRRSASSEFRGFPYPSREFPRVTTTDVWEALVAIREIRTQRERERRNPGAEFQTRMQIIRMSSGFLDPSREQRRRRNSADREDTGRDREESDSPNEGERDSSIRINPILIRYRPPHRRDDSGGFEAIRGTNINRQYFDRHHIDRQYVLLGSRHRVPARILVEDHNLSRERKIIKENKRRLTHYIEEPNVGKGFIKELCFSADGRLICSPFGYGVRFLSFSPECSELPNCLPLNYSKKLHELGSVTSHKDIVVSTKFSPLHCMLVSGCLSGKICWYQPVF